MTQSQGVAIQIQNGILSLDGAGAAGFHTDIEAAFHIGQQGDGGSGSGSGGICTSFNSRKRVCQRGKSLITDLGNGKFNCLTVDLHVIKYAAVTDGCTGNVVTLDRIVGVVAVDNIGQSSLDQLAGTIDSQGQVAFAVVADIPSGI